MIKRNDDPPDEIEEMWDESNGEDIIHETERGWWFWDEVWNKRYGPYDTEEIAEEECRTYAKALLL